MKKAYSILVVLLLFSTLFLSSQTTQYQLKKIDGKNYILYPVQPGEGMYAVARKFNVAYKDLNTLNPEAVNGLKTGQILLIPATAQLASNTVSNGNKASGTQQPSVKSNNTVKTTEKKDYQLHTVEKKQTLFAISKQYGVCQDELKRINPELENGLKAGMILKIPKSTIGNTMAPKSYQNSNTISTNNVSEEPAKAQVEQKQEKKEVKPTFFERLFGKNKKQEVTTTIKHQVKAKETLYAISKMYHITMEDIVKQNPFTSDGLVIGTELTLDIPKSVADTLTINASKPISQDTTTNQNNDENRYLTRVNNKIKPNIKAIKIGILLPMVIENPKSDAVNERFQEFYAGFLIAANEAKSKGISLEIFTFDSGKTEETIANALNNPELKTVDLIIGPAYTNQISFVGEFARENRINTIIPFSSKVPDLDMNPYLFQFNPSLNVEIEYLTNLLKNKYSSDNLILVDIARVSTNDNGKQFISELQNSLRNNNRSFSYIDSANELNIQSAINFEKGKRNIVFFNTDKYSGVFPYFTFLNSKSAEYDIMVYEQYSWKNQNQQSKFQTFSIAPFKPLLNDSDFTEYNQLFEKYFNWKISTNNPRYDVIGYDLGNYFIALLYEIGPKFNENKRKLPLASGVQSFIKFERSSLYTGFINKQLYQHLK